MNIQIRPACNSDINTIKHIVYQVLREYGLQPDGGSADKDIEDIDAYYAQQGGYFGIAEYEQNIIATVGIFRRDEYTCELRKMYMLANFRGQGFGKKLLEFSLTKARELGFRTMILETASPLKEAIALYQQYGFCEYQTENLVSRCDKAFKLEL